MHTSGSARARRRSHREREPLPPLRPSRDDGQAGLTLEVYLARHGETEWSLSGQHTGTTDLPLTTRGEERAAALGARLTGIHFDAVYSSPMQRAWRTARLAGFADPEITPLLREVDYGEYEGLTSDQIHATHPGWDVFKDGCPGGESPVDIYDRAQRLIEFLVNSGGRRLLAFGHGHIMRATAVAWIRADIKVAIALQLDVATLNILSDAERGRVIALWNSP